MESRREEKSENAHLAALLDASKDLVTMMNQRGNSFRSGPVWFVDGLKGFVKLIVKNEVRRLRTKVWLAQEHRM